MERLCTRCESNEWKVCICWGLTLTQGSSVKFTAATVGAFAAETPEGLLDIAFAGVTAEGFSRLLLASQTAPGVWGDARVVFAPAGNLYGFSALVTLGQSVIAAADGVGPLWMTPPQEGTGLWSAKALGGLATPIDLALADVTGDGLVDLVASTPESSTSLFHTHTHTYRINTHTNPYSFFVSNSLSVCWKGCGESAAVPAVAAVASRAHPVRAEPYASVFFGKDCTHFSGLCGGHCCPGCPGPCRGRHEALLPASSFCLCSPHHRPSNRVWSHPSPCHLYASRSTTCASHCPTINVQATWTPRRHVECG